MTIFCFRIGQGFFKNAEQFVDFVVVAGFLVEDEGAVAHHAHLREAQDEHAAVFFVEEVEPAPFGHQTRHGVRQIAVDARLFGRHGHKQDLVHAFGHLFEHLFFPVRRSRQPDIVSPISFQVFIALYLPVVPNTLLVLVQKAVQRRQAVLVDKLGDGVQVFEFVFDGGRSTRYNGASALF